MSHGVQVTKYGLVVQPLHHVCDGDHFLLFGQAGRGK